MLHGLRAFAFPHLLMSPHQPRRRSRRYSNILPAPNHETAVRHQTQSTAAERRQRREQALLDQALEKALVEQAQVEQAQVEQAQVELTRRQELRSIAMHVLQLP